MGTTPRRTVAVIDDEFYGLGSNLQCFGTSTRARYEIEIHLIGRVTL